MQPALDEQGAGLSFHAQRRDRRPHRVPVIASLQYRQPRAHHHALTPSASTHAAAPTAINGSQTGA